MSWAAGCRLPTAVCRLPTATGRRARRLAWIQCAATARPGSTGSGRRWWSGRADCRERPPPAQSCARHSSGPVPRRQTSRKWPPTPRTWTASSPAPPGSPRTRPRSEGLGFTGLGPRGRVPVTGSAATPRRPVKVAKPPSRHGVVHFVHLVGAASGPHLRRQLLLTHRHAMQVQRWMLLDRAPQGLVQAPHQSRGRRSAVQPALLATGVQQVVQGITDMHGGDCISCAVVGASALRRLGIDARPVAWPGTSAAVAKAGRPRPSSAARGVRTGRPSPAGDRRPRRPAKWRRQLPSPSGGPPQPPPPGSRASCGG